MTDIGERLPASSEPSEIELKFEITAADMAQLRAQPPGGGQVANVQDLVSVYFDTDEFELRDHGVTLRVRRAGDTFVQTVKHRATPNLIERQEWNQPLGGPHPNLDAATDTAIAALLTDHVRSTLKPVFETRVQRTTYRLDGNGADIEMAFDEGEIVAGDKSSRIAEVELELISGDQAAMYRLAHDIAAAIPAQLAVKSKSDRGYDLIDGTAGAVVKADDVEIAPHQSAAQAFQAIALACLHQLVANKPAMLARNAEALHQMRVAIRRLRTAIGLFSSVVADPHTKELKANLKWLGKELSPARDLDVLIMEVIRPLRRRHPDNPGLRSLQRTFATQRRGAHQRAIDAAASARFRMLLVDTAQWINAGAWVTSTDDLTMLRRTWPAQSVAMDELSRLRKKIRKKGAHLRSLDAHSRHKLRIEAKKTRYATEFFATLFPDKKARKRRETFVKSLKRMQSSLGALNDVEVRKTMCADLVAKASKGGKANSVHQRIFAAGLIAGDQEARAQHLIDDAAKSYADFDDAKPFWT